MKNFAQTRQFPHKPLIFKDLRLDHPASLVAAYLDKGV